MEINPWTREATPILGRATTGTSKCRSCDQRIPQGDIRVGVIFHHMNGYIALDWHHLLCCQSPELLQSVEGYELLTVTEKDTIEAYASSQTGTKTDSGNVLVA
ncbi:hypothetical protein ACHHYP_13066 [Achlya hypogyna]|uniref:PARP-type domain-containing protein n=1 Tax=Achlya hypogyna TaxID=1202772 RepID=A0A1V9YG59_ACHHY|nr:hypothetical protein ACHHYP_13066 [Achlya hypogyna]